MGFQHTPAPPNSGVEFSRCSYGQQRFRHFGLSMIVMGVSFILYYLGLFGSVDGPLNPSQLGTLLAVGGVSKAHILMIATGLTLLTLTWNWIYNLAGLLLGTRRTCSRINAHGGICRKPIEGRHTIRTKDGKSIARYVCALGHKRTDAQFHLLKKGVIGHMLWVISLILTVIVFYAGYC